jgi:hypothetical protein
MNSAAFPRLLQDSRLELIHMDNWTFGWTLALIGAIGTMLVLWIMSLLILLIRKIFPYAPEDSGAKKG